MISDSDMFYFYIGIAILFFLIILAIVNEIMISRSDKKETAARNILLDERHDRDCTICN